MRVKRRDSEQWMHHRLLPQELRERVRRYDQYKWLETRGVDEESLVRSLPKDLRRDIKRHLCLALVRRVISYIFQNTSCCFQRFLFHSFNVNGISHCYENYNVVIILISSQPCHMVRKSALCEIYHDQYPLAG